MLDKSSEQILNSDLTCIQKEFEQNIPSVVLCTESFHKVEFLSRLINSVKDPIIFIDTDLLYTGHVTSGIIPQKNNVIIFHPNNTNWKKKLLEVIIRISKEKSLVVIDSLNGLYNIFDNHEAVRFVNSCIMLLASIGKQTKCTVVITTIARKKEKNDWVLSPGGKPIIKSGETEIYLLKKVKNSLIINTIEKSSLNSKIFTITQENN